MVTTKEHIKKEAAARIEREQRQLMNNLPKIYLAGRVSGDKWKLIAQYKDVANWVASDGGNHSEHGWGWGYWDFNNKELRESLKVHALDVINQCIGLVAYLYDDKSYGSIAEIAYASTKGKQCHVIIRHQPTPNHEPWGSPLLDAYWFVCHFPTVTVHEVFCDCMAAGIIENILRGWKVIA
jgi:hypothetical protein